MIPNQWYAILEAKEVPRGKPIGVTRLGEKLVLWRDSHGAVTCQRDFCPHRGVALSAGTLQGDCIICPFHGFQYDPSGRCKLIPANGQTAPTPKVMHVYSYPTQEAHGFIWIFWGEPAGELPPLPWFENLEDDFPYLTYPYHWKTHYSRAIENQLDVVHLPFVHHNTIGRGNRTVVDGPVATLEGDLLRLWVTNRQEDGTPAIRASALPVPNRAPFLYFRFPNIWENNIAPDFRVMVAFAPVDEGNTILYLRVYQRFIRIPILRELTLWMNLFASIFIARQDRVVVETQRPLRSDLHVPEQPIPGDAPIILYRKHRRALLDAAGQKEST
jgi:phenylpropionate dioxygenase-like ring-hydroxylating dioxygenase large terminal subunit